MVVDQAERAINVKVEVYSIHCDQISRISEYGL